MKKNGLLQTFFYNFLKIQVTNYGSFEEMKKGTLAIHGTTFFFYQKGHGATPFYFFFRYIFLPETSACG
jgi:hypothetical protein